MEFGVLLDLFEKVFEAVGVGVHVEGAEAFEVLAEDGADFFRADPDISDFFGGVESKDEFTHVASGSTDDAGFGAAVDAVFGCVFEEATDGNPVEVFFGGKMIFDLGGGDDFAGRSRG